MKDMISYDRNFWYRRHGQSLIELLIAIGVGTILIVAAVSVMVPALLVSRQVTPVQTGASLGTELLNNVRAWSEGDWHKVLALATGTANTYYLNTSLSPYQTAPGVESIVQLPVALGLVGWWKFDEGTGTMAFDSSGNGNNGTLAGATPPARVLGVVGMGALSFDGVNATINLSNSSSFDSMTSSFTISHWIKTVSALGQMYTVSNAGGGNGYRFGLNSGYIEFLVGNSLVFKESNCGSQTVNDGTWHMITGVFNLSGTNQFDCYIDGAYQASVGLPSNFTGMLTTAPGIGKPPCCQPVNGSLDDVRIYNRALSAAEVNQIYLATPATIASGLVGWWKFDEGTGTIAQDASGNGNIGTRSVGTTWAAGKIGSGALSFSGLNSNSYLNVGSSIMLNPSRFTISAWVSPADVSGYYNYIYSNARDCCGVYNGIEFSIQSNKLYASIWNGTDAVLFSSATIANNSGWQLVTITYDGAFIKMYINGALNNSVGTALGVGTPASFGNTIGGMGMGPAVYDFNGLIDDVRIYNRALSAKEINQIYTSATYARSFYLSDVYRVGGNIVTSGGTYDPSTKLVTVVYQLPSGATSSFASYFTRHGQAIYDQTDWSGGSGANGPATTTNNQFTTSSNINYSTTTGSIYVAIPGY